MLLKETTQCALAASEREKTDLQERATTRSTAAPLEPLYAGSHVVH
jgi:hypothetical protein